MCDFSRYGGSGAEWDEVQATLPPPSISPGESIQEQKLKVNQAREEAAAKLMTVFGKDVEMEDYVVPTRDGQTIEARTYRSKTAAHVDGKLPGYIHLHGGGFVFGTIATEDGICSNIALNTGVVVINVNYRHTPEHPYPTPWDDAEDAFIWIHSMTDQLGIDRDRVIMGGISAGAHLTASLALGQRLGTAANTDSCPPLAGQVLMIPALCHKACYGPQYAKLTDASVSSHKENEDAPILPKATVELFLGLLQVKNLDENDLKLNPANATSDQVKGLPPTTFGIAGLDPLRDEGLLYAKLLAESEVPTNVHLFQGVPHGFRKFGDKLSASRRWDKVIEEGIAFALKKPTATGKFIIKTE